MSHARPAHLARRLLALALAYFVVVGSVPAALAQKPGPKDKTGARASEGKRPDAAKAKPADKSDGPRPLGVNSWTTTGPEGLEQIDQFVVNPNANQTVYAVSADSNVYRSTDGGATWSPRNNGFGVVAVNRLAIDPTAPGDTLYAATDSTSIEPDIYKTTDGGANWIGLTNGLPSSNGANVVAVDPVTPATVYAGYAGQGVFKTANGGGAWTAANTGLPTSPTITDLVIDPFNPANLYAAVNSTTAAARGVYKTTNGGASWTKMSTGLATGSVTPAVLLADPVTNGVVFAAVTDNNPAAAGNTPELYRTTDGGASWAASSAGLADKFPQSMAATATGKLYFVSASDTSQSTDGGASWTPTGTNGYNAPWPQSVGTDPTDANVLFSGTEDVGVYKSTDGGANWTWSSAGLSRDDYSDQLAISPVNSSVIYSCQQSSGIFKSTDGGASWTPASKGFKSSFAICLSLAIDPSDPDVLYAGTSGDRVFKSTDAAATWTQVGVGSPGNDIEALAVDPSNPQIVYASETNSGVYKSTDGGATFSPSNAGIALDDVFDLDFDPTNSAIIYATVGNTDATRDGVYKSTNAGATWTRMSAGITNPDLYQLAVVPAAPQTLYASGTGGVFRSTDGAATWSPINAGLPAGEAVYSVAADPSNAQRVYAGVTDNGVYQSADGGQTWSALGTGLPALEMLTIAVSASGNKVFVGTSQGVYEYQIVTSGTFIVNSTLDAADADTADGLCNDGAGNCTLRAAIQQANATAGADSIQFDIPGAGPHTISLAAAPPGVTEAVTIDGYSEPGASPNTLPVGNNATILVRLDGQPLTIAASGVAVRGLSFTNSGISLVGASNTIIEGNFVGLDPAGADGDGQGIEITGGANNFIGTTGPAGRNVISGSTVAGIVLGNTAGNVVRNNYVGTNPAGTAAVQNSSTGVLVTDAPGSVIGGASAAARNVVSGNNADGIRVDGNSPGVVIQGNYVGTNAAGTAAVANLLDGVFVGVANNATVGGAAAGAGNLLSGNTNAGLNLNGSTGNVVRGNLVGTDAAGTGGVPNGAGIVVFTSNNQIGGAAAGAGNTVASNAGAGIAVNGGTTTGVLVSGNSVHSNGALGIDLGNDGVTANDGAGDADTGANNLQNFPALATAMSAANSTTVTGTLTSAPNTQYAVEFFSSASCDASGNGEGRTFLGSQNVTTDGAGAAAINATLARASFMGEAVTATATDPAGNTSEFSACVTVSSPDLVVTNTADAGAGSLRQAILDANTQAGAQSIVFNIPGTGPHTITPASALPQITDPVTIDGYTQPGASVNTLAAGDNAVIKVELNGAAAGTNAAGLRLVAGGSGSTVRGLAINRFDGDGILLDGGDNNTISGNFIGTDPTGLVDLGNFGEGVNFESASNTDNNLVGGTTPAARNVISGNGGGGIGFDAPASGNTVQGNFIGLAANGTTALGNDAEGINADAAITGLLVGGDDAADGAADGTVHARNYIAANNSFGIFLGGTGFVSATVRGNYVGTDVTGTLDRGNGLDGISTNNAPGTVIGGATAGAGNLISGNGDNGVGVGNTTGIVIRGNRIGTQADGVSPLGNDSNGIYFFTVSGGGQVGGAAAGEGNLIAFNDESGVQVHSGTGNSVLSNSIHSNGALTTTLGISLDFDGVTPNDANDADTGANNFQNFPVLNSAVSSGGTTTVQGTLNSAASTAFRVEFFSNAACDAGGNGEGRTFLGAQDVTTDAAGNATVNATLAAAVTAGEVVTATATDPAGNTSEFSACHVVTPQPVFVINTNDSGAGSLRAAIAAANAAPGLDAIHFNIPGAGPHVISPATPLPTITDPVILDATTQPGYAGTPLVQFDGNAAGGGSSGLHVTAGGSTIRGLSVTRFDDHGIFLETGDGNAVEACYLGTNPAGAAGFGNGRNGVYLDNSSNNNTVGGSSAARRNVISANGESGVQIFSGTGNIVRANFVGVAPDGTTPLGNTLPGVMINTAGTNNFIGGTGADEGNAIAHSLNDAGVLVSGGTGNRILSNSIRANAGRGIMLMSGGNADQPAPALTGATFPAGVGSVQGTLSAAPNTTYRVEVFQNVACDSSGAGEGEKVLGGFEVTTDGAGAGAFDQPVSGFVPGDILTATATSPAGNTSAFSQCFTASSVLTVTTTADAGAGSLRQAIVDANSTAGTQTIAFNLAGAGVHTITPTSALPNITDPVVIDGYTQPGASPNTLAVGNDAVLLVEIDGSGQPSDLFHLLSSNNVIRGLVVNRAPFDGIQFGSGSAGNVIEGNFIGTDPTGTIARPNNRFGVSLYFLPSSNNVIGGTTPAARNVISGNGQGVVIGSAGSTGNVVRGNYIGTTASGAAILPNVSRGVFVGDGATNNVIGGATVADRNVISGNDGTGVFLNGTGATNNDVLGNYIGLNAAGTATLRNFGHGVDVGGGSATGNTILSNLISGNQALGINLDDNAVTPNDAGDPDAGANNLQNYPVITSAVRGGGNTAVLGTLNSTPSTSGFVVEFFASPACDPAGNGEGQRLLGSVTVNTDSEGNAAINTTLAAATVAGEALTATATDPAGNTSEFSQCRTIVNTPQTFTVTNTADSGAGSLRQAITDANANNLAADTVAFSIPGAGPHTIAPLSALPTITDPVTIDGYTQGDATAGDPTDDATENTLAAGSNAVIKIELNGAGAGAGTNGLSLAASASGSTVRGLVVNRFTRDGISLDGGDNNTISGNFIGTDPAGLADLGNGSVGIESEFFTNSNNNVIGGLTPAARNVISGNGGSGIEFSTSTGNAIYGNIIGLGADGATAIGNGGTGIVVGSFAAAFQIGGGDAEDGAADGTVHARNVIGANGGSGIFLGGAGFGGATVQGNYIGTNAAGTLARPNVNGIDTNLAHGSTVGGAAAGQGNLISGNTFQGIVVGNTGSFVVRRNLIGTAADGVTALGNGANGIVFGAGSSNAQIGGTESSLGNVIAFNGGDGVQIDAGTGNLILSNSIHSNGTTNLHLGIDLGADGVQANDANDPDTGANNLQNFPVITSATGAAGQSTIQGTLNSTPNATFRVEFFSTPACDAGGNGEGRTFLGAKDVTTDAAGNATFTAVLPVGTTAGHAVTATATGAASNSTSEFSQCGTVTTGAMTFTVTNTGDAGAGSLRQAILDANANAGTDTVAFNIPGAGVHTISPLSALPTITQPVTIDGSTQPGYAGAPLVELNGAGAGASVSGLTITAGSSTVRALVINRFTANGIVLQTGGSNTVEGCYIGTDVAGTSDLGNTLDGISINASANNQIGGTTSTPGTGAGNVISGNNSDGVMIQGAAASGNVLRGNLIGLALGGNAALGNGRGVFTNSPSNTVGGATAQARNVISGNTAEGVEISGEAADNNTIQGNYIGTNLAGTADLGNGNDGIQITVGPDNCVIGGLAAIPGTAPGNVISGNNEEGVAIDNLTTTGHQILGNIIGLNAAGTAALRNESDGVLLIDTSANQIGGSDPQARNVISGNNQGAGDRGIEITGNNADNNVIQGNYIGTDITGTIDLGNADEGILITSGDTNTVGGSTATPGQAPGNVISGNATDGVGIAGSGNLVRGNIIGLNAAGTAALGNSNHGISVGGGGSSTTIGGATSDLRNVVSANGADGLRLGDAIINGNDNNTVAGNYIGTDITGTIDLGNAGDGIEFVNASPVTVGGSTATPGAAPGNVISGNGGSGINNTGFSVTITGNLIGLKASGTEALANTGHGILINDRPNTTVGGVTADLRNVISANGGNGVFVNASDTSNILGNYIGTDAGGTADLGNTLAGVRVAGTASSNNIGGAAAGAGNVISGNTTQGIFLGNDNGISAGVNLTTIQGNFIGTQADGTTALPNGGNGVEVNQFNPATANNQIGGTSAGAANTIAFNGANGVQIANNITRNRVSANSIHSNTLLGINLGPAGVTPNDGGDADGGGNTLQNFPVMTSAVRTGPATTAVSGTLNSTASGTFNVEFFASAACDASGSGEGARFLGSTTVTTDAAGSGSFATTLNSATTAGEFITSTATDANGNTSEFSVCRPAGDVINWVNAAGGNWNTAANWVDGAAVARVPTANDAVRITLDGTYTVNLDVNATVASLTLGGTSGAQTLSVTTSTLSLGGASTVNANGVVGLGGSGGTVTGPGPLSIGGALNWTDGNLSVGTTNVAAAGAVNVSGAAVKGLSGALNNAGTLTWAGAGDLRFTSGTLTNLAGATFDIQNDAQLIDFDGTGTPASFANAGTLRKSAGAATSSFNLVALLNSGAVEVQTGTLALNHTFTQTAGSVFLNGGNLSSANTFSLQGGELRGTGQFIGNVNNTGGTVRPGASPGCLNVGGNYTQAAGGALDIEIGGATACTQFDRLAVTGAATLDGALNLTLTGGFNPAGGAAFAVLTYGSRAGTFAAVNGPFTTVYNANDLTVVKTANAAQTFTVTTTADSGAGSLRQAILDANANAGATDTIQFNIAGGGVKTISPASALPTITDAVVIDGYTQPGASANTLAVGSDAVLLVELDGTGAGAGAGGLVITAGSSAVRGLVVNRFGGAGVVLQTNGSNVVEGNFIGTNAAGTADLGNFHGILVDNSAGNQIGSATPAGRNVVSGNGSLGGGGGGDGVSLFNGSANNLIRNNYVGTTASGTTALQNNNNGVLISGGSNNTVGGLTAAARNVVSGNRDSNVELTAATTGNLIQGNFVGPDANGAALASGVGLDGVEIRGNSTNNTVGGAAAGAGNLISGNAQHGVSVGGGSGNVVRQNRIGTAGDGTSDLGNAGGGVFIFASTANVVGGSAANEANLIAFNGIGVGVSLSSTGNRVSADSIHSNDDFGIDLELDGVTPNDAGDADTGSNNIQNFPVLTTATAAGGTTTVQGTLNSAASTAFRVEFFSSASCDASGNGEGRTFLGAQDVTTDAAGNATVNATLAAATTVGEAVTATATDPAGNTSEFSACRAVTTAGAATDVSWTNAAGGNWHTAANWQDGTGASRVPSANDNVFITLAGSYTVTMSADARPASLTLGDGAGAQTLNTGAFTLTLANASTVRANAVLNLDGTLAGAGALEVLGTLHHNGNVAAGAGAINVRAGGVVNFGGTQPTLARTLNNEGTANYNPASSMILNGAALNNLVGSTFNVAAEKVLAQQGAVSAFVNRGTVRKAAGAGETEFNLPFDNMGTVDLQSGSLRFGAGGASTGAFNGAAGTVLKLNSHALQAGSSVAAVAVEFSGANGTVAGTYNVTGTTTAGGTTNFTGNVQNVGQTLNVTGTAGFNSNAVSAQTINITGSVNGTAELSPTATGTLNLSGALDGTGATNVAATATLNLQGTQPRLSRTLNNLGTANYAPTSSMVFNGATFNNQSGGVFNVQSDALLFQLGGASTFNNAGTLRKLTGTGDTEFRLSFNNGGAVDLQSGGLDFSVGGASAGTFTATAGTQLKLNGHNLQPASVVNAVTLSLSGATTVAGTFNVSQTTNVNAGTSTFTGNVASVGQTLNVAGTAHFNSNAVSAPAVNVTGTLGGSANVSPVSPGALDLNGGTLTGAGATNIPAGATLTLRGTQPTVSRAVNNSGTANYAATSSLVFNGGAFNNLAGGVFNVNSETLLFELGAPSTFTNAGTVRKTTGAGAAEFRLGFDNNGTVDLQSGELSFSARGTSNGAFNGAAGTTLRLAGQTLQAASTVAAPTVFLSGTTAFAGTLNVTGTTNVAGTATFTGNVQNAGQTLNVTGAGTFNSNAVSAPTVNVTGTLGGSADVTVPAGGTFNLTGGTLASGGTTTIPATATLNLGGTQPTLARTLNNAGTANYAATSGMVFNGSTFNNLAGGVFNVQSDTVLQQAGAGATFNNSGALRKDAGAGAAEFRLAFANAGTVTASAGTLHFSVGNYTQTAGDTVLNGGNVQTTGLLDVQGGVLRGAGTITGNVRNAAAVRPGSSPGCMIINGDYTQAVGATLDTEIGGTTPCTQYDRLQVTGAATLAGTLAATLVSGYVPAPAQSFQAVTFASRNGQFANVTGPLAVTHNGTNVMLSATPSSTIVVTNTADSGAGSLRQAILDSNAQAGVDTINFQIPAAAADPGCDPATGVCTISPLSALPNVTDPVTIDGYTQTGASVNTLAVGNNAVLLVVLSGANLAAGSVGLKITAGSSTVRGLVVNRFGIGVELSAAGGNTIQGNRIGTNAAGTSPLGNAIGLLTTDGSTGNLVGGASAAARNLVSGNTANGIFLGTGGNTVQGNYVGTNADTSESLQNGASGVAVVGSSGNDIGGTTAATRNVIGGNAGSGVEISDSSATNNVVRGNYIGTNAAGAAALPNAQGGVDVSGAPGNTIGGTAAGAGNLISGNGNAGVRISGSNATGNTVQGNFIGTDAAGTAAVSNAPDGVVIANAAASNTVGGTTAGAGNLIAFNAGNGISHTGGAGNAFPSNSIHSNGTTAADLGIDLGANGVTANDAGDGDTGANDLQNFPLITAAIASGGATQITGNLNSAPNAAFNVEFFSSPACDASGSGEGQTFLGRVTVTTDAAGNAPLSFVVAPGLPVGQSVTATATDAANNTSEFSACRAVAGPPPATFTISGTVSDADGNPVGDVVMTLSGATNATTTTNSTGSYSFSNLAGGANYTVTPSLANFSFAPASRIYNSLAADQTAQNFTATANPGTVEFSAANYSASEPGGGIFVTLTRTGNTAGAATINYTDTPGTASAADYSGGTGSVTFAAGETTKTFTVGVTNDTLDEPDESFTLTLSVGSGNVVLGAQNTATVTITDDDAAPSLSVGDVTLAEGNSGQSSATFQLTLSAASGQLVTVNFATADGTATSAAGGDYAAQAGTATFPAGTTTFAVSVPVNGDTAVEPDETFFLDLTSPANATLGDAQGQATITNDDAAPTFSISGRVTNSANNQPLANVTVTLSGGQSATTQTDANGDYSFANLAGGGNYTVTPALANHTFAPPSRSFSSLAANQSGDFSGTLNAFAVAGRVADGANNPLSGVTVTLSGAQSATTQTDAGGNYSFASLPAGGTYTVTPSLANFSFAPLSRTFDNLQANQTADFTGGLASVVLSGRITDENAQPVGGVTVALVAPISDDSEQPLSTTQTDANGDYSFVAPVGGSYVVRPASAGLIFTPPVHIFRNANGNRTGDFRALDAFVISGNLTDLVAPTAKAARAQAAAEAGNVVVTLSGTRSGTTLTDAAGNYTFTNLPLGGTYRVTPQNPFNLFDPPFAAFPNLGGNGTADFGADANPNPTPTPPIRDDFSGATRDPDRFSLGTLTQPAGATDPLVTVEQQGGRLVITPRTNFTGLSFNGYVTTRSVDFTNATASIRVDQIATGGAQTIFSVGRDDQNFFRFAAQEVEDTTSATAGGGKSRVGASNTLQQLLLQVRAAGIFNSLSIPYDPVAHKYWRFRHDASASPVPAMFFEVSPSGADGSWTPVRIVPVAGAIGSLAVEISAGTAGAVASPGQAIFDDLNVVPAQTAVAVGAYRLTETAMSVAEGAGSLQVRVRRTGVLAGESFVDIASEPFDNRPCSTVDGRARPRCDFSTTFARLRFAPNESEKIVTVFLTNDVYVEGNETFRLALGNPSGGFSIDAAVVNVTIRDDDQPGGRNPINETDFFVRQQYLDFLNREPDAGGFAAWTGVLRQCAFEGHFGPGKSNSDPNCDRILVSSSFYRSTEFHERGFFAYRFYEVALGRRPTYDEFLSDMQRLSGFQTEAEQEANKVAFVREFMTRGSFGGRQSFADMNGGLDTPARLDQLLARAGLTLANRDQLAADLAAGRMTPAQVLRAVAESNEASAKFYNRAFVAMQYFGYLQRDPEPSGFQAWLNHLNANPTDYRTMIFGFLYSHEYQSRFGPVQ